MAGHLHQMHTAPWQRTTRDHLAPVVQQLKEQTELAANPTNFDGFQARGL